MAGFPIIIEREVKILGVQYPLLVRSLFKHGAKKFGAMYIRDWYVDLEKGTTKVFGKKVRLRSYGGEKFEVTVKTKMDAGEGNETHKVRHEENIPVPNLEAGKLLLHTMGFVCKKYKEKIRVSYQIGETMFDVDFYDDIPPVLEIEGTEHQINYRIRKLRLQNHKQVNRGAKKLLKHYGKKMQKLEGSIAEIEM